MASQLVSVCGVLVVGLVILAISLRDSHRNPGQRARDGSEGLRVFQGKVLGSGMVGAAVIVMVIKLLQLIADR